MNSSVTSHDVPVCLHQGMQGMSPVLITLPFQTNDNLQTFIPCSTCHQPNTSGPSIYATQTVAFCVSEVNIRTAQLTLMPCFLCWRPAVHSGMPDRITVPLFPTDGEAGQIGSPESVRFVPCAVCLRSDHGDIDANALSDIQDQLKNFSLTESTVLKTVATSTEHSDDEKSESFDSEVNMSWFIPFSKQPTAQKEEASTPSLQMAFIKHCSGIIQNSCQRQREIPVLAKARSVQKCKGRVRTKQEISTQNVQKNVPRLPLNHKAMRDQTEKIYSRLPEYNSQHKQRLKEQLNQTHRLMAHIFQKKLQQATLRGKVSWQITESCM